MDSAMPKAQDAANWDNPPLMKAPEGASPRVSTLVGQRDGSRPEGPLPPEFTLSSTSSSITATITESNGATLYEIRVDAGPAVSGLTYPDLTPEQVYSVQVRGTDANGTGAWSTAVDKATAAAAPPAQGVLIEESFDDWPDWDSELDVNDQGFYPPGEIDFTQYASTHTLPGSAHAVRQVPKWSPKRGHPDRHPVIQVNSETIAENPNRARGGTGKSWVSWRDSNAPSWTGSGTIEDGQYVMIRMVAPGTVGETATATLEVGGDAYTFSATASASPTYSQPSSTTVLSEFPHVQCEPEQRVYSGVIQVPNGGTATLSGDFADYRRTSNLNSWPNSQYWNSDGIMFFRMPGDGVTEVYVEFWMNFSNEAIEVFDRDEFGISKFLRICHHDSPDDPYYSDYWEFFGSSNKPAYYWDLKGDPDEYGLENTYAIHRHAGGLNLNDTIPNLHRNFLNGGNVSNYGTNSWGTPGHGLNGTDPVLADLKNGGNIDSGLVTMEQVFGDETVWRKFAHYIKLNSAGGVADGELSHFVDDQRTLHMTGIEWITAQQVWEDSWINLVGLGGNDFLQAYTNAHRHEHWYAIDDLVIRDSLPEHLRED